MAMKMSAALLAGCALFAASPSFAQSVMKEIEAANARFEQDFGKGDAAALARMYTENATVLPPDSDMLTGRDAIQAFWQGAIQSGLKNLTLKAVQVDELGAAAAKEIGRFTLEVPAPQNQMAKIEGKYVVVWRKVGNDWKLDADIWNMNAPAKAASQ
jgi:uncharacterized protein (TIGR02246 family)